MGAVKNWLEHHVPEMSDEELRKALFAGERMSDSEIQEEIKFLRECFDPKFEES